MAPLHSGPAPPLEKFLKSLKGHTLDTSIEGIVYLLKRRQVRGDACATATAHVLLQVVAKSKWHDVNQLLISIQKVGRRLVQAAPHELIIGNIVRRVMGLIRDEASEDRNADDVSESASDVQSVVHGGVNEPSVSATTMSVRSGGGSTSGAAPRLPPLPTSSSFHASKSMFNLLLATNTGVTADSGSPVTGSSTPTHQWQSPSVHALRSEVIDGIEEIIDEISQADEQIASFSDVQIQPGDCVLAYQPTPTVERFLMRAATKKRFTVFIALSNPGAGRTGGSGTGAGGEAVPYAALRKKLNNAGVATVNIASCGVMAYMPRVNKVVLGAKTVLSNGGVLADGGAAIVARAAHEYAKPVFCLSAVYKLCPEDVLDADFLTDLGEPSSFVQFADGLMVDRAYVENAVAEYVAPELVDIYITNLGPHSQTHLSTVMADHYKPEDIDFHLQ